MAKLLPCKTDSCHFALWPKSEKHPEGEPAICGQYVDKYPCSRCGAMNTLTTAAWHSLPEMSIGHFEALAFHFHSHEAKEAIRGLPTADFEAFGLSKEHGRDLFRAGLTVGELQAGARGAEARTAETDAIH